MPTSLKLALYGVGLVIALIIFLAINPVVVVDSTERGLLFNWGALQQTVLEPGIHLRMPIKQKVETVTIQPIQLDHSVAVGSDGAITKDNQTVGADITVFYRYDTSRLPEMWQQYGTEKIKNIIMQTLREDFKVVLGEYDIFKLPISQAEIQNKVVEKTKGKLAGYPIEITELKIVNYDWSDQFDSQIQETMSRAQQVKQKEQELLIAEQEAQKQVKQAEAQKTAIITKAEGEKEAARLNAEAKAMEGEGIRKYNESIAKNMDQEIRFRQLEIERLRVEKWNGQYVPVNNYGPIPLETGALQGK